VYMVEVIAKSHCYKQQLISCRLSTCLLLWQGKEVRYSRNSPHVPGLGYGHNGQRRVFAHGNGGKRISDEVTWRRGPR